MESGTDDRTIPHGRIHAHQIIEEQDAPASHRQQKLTQFLPVQIDDFHAVTESANLLAHIIQARDN